MRALTFRGKAAVACETVPDPCLQAATDAIVRVRLAAICGSDLHPYHEREKGLDHGTVMGHEFVGEVVEAGRDAGIAVGDSVLSPFTTSCGSCFYCRRGLSARCEVGELFGWVSSGVGLQGAQAELVRVPLAAGTLVKVPDGIDDVVALLLGDVLSTGYYCALRAELSAGGTCAVIGCGPVGLMAVVAARELGASEVWAADRVPERLALAARYGAAVIDVSREDAPETIRDATSGRGVDAVLEAVGTPAASRLAMELVRPGGTISIVGVHNEDRFSFSPTEAYDRNLTVRIGRCPARSVIDELVPLARSRRDDLAALVTHRLRLADGPDAYETFDRKRDGCIKVVLEP